VKPVLWIAIGAVFLPGFALAQTDADRAFAQCGTVADPNARLACYDAARNQNKSAHWPEFGGAAPTQTPSAQQPIPTQQAARPLPLPDQGKLVAAVTHFSLGHDGHFTVVLANGETWRQTDSDDGAAQFNQNGRNMVQISKGFWGSYDLRLNASNTVFKVTRVK
jgi:hypothetical protein